MRLAAAGQALVERLPGPTWRSGFSPVEAVLAAADMAFVNLETALRTGSAMWPTKEAVLHTAPPAVLDWLRSVGFNSLSVANNHAGDLGPAALLDACAAMSSRGFLVAGAGADQAGAAAPGWRADWPVPIALVAVSAGRPPVAGAALDGAHDLPGRPGVNALRVTRELEAEETTFEVLRRFVEDTGHAGRVRRDVAAGRRRPLPDDLIDLFGTPVRRSASCGERDVPDPVDEERVVAGCRAAAASGSSCVVSIHNHAWPPDWAEVPDWLPGLAHRCIDAGALAVFVHGAPVTGPVEVYRNRPILYGLGNLVFHTSRPDGYPAPEVWQGFVFEGDFSSDGRLCSARLVPVVIDRDGPDGGFPRAAGGPERTTILARVDTQCRPWGTTVVREAPAAGTLSWAAASARTR